MVSTRGGARTSGPESSMETTLRKKPVRKATAKTTQTATKAKTTRSKKAEPAPEPEEDDTADEIQQEMPAPAPKTTRRAAAAKQEEAPKPTRRAATRVKKDEEEAPKPAAPAPKAATKTTKGTASTRNAKSQPAKDEKPSLPPPTQSRATRATRATAAKDKTAPLSPKKITQVSKAPAKTTRAAAAKPLAPKAGPNAAPVQSKPATRRRRNVSDENAEIPELRPTPQEESDDEIQVQPRKASKAKAASKQAPEPVVIDDETPASSRPTTPSEAIGQSFDNTEDETQETNEQDQSEDQEEEEVDSSNSISHDELCGPKTPMKRCSPREGGRFTSAQKSAQPIDPEVPMKTPVRRFNVLGTQQGTPQTQKPYCKPAVPMSEVRPMTVARANDRAMVFPKLQPLQNLDESEAGTDDQCESPEDESTPVPVEMAAEVDEDLETTMEGSTAEDDRPTPPEGQQLDESLLLDPETLGADIDDIEMEDTSEEVESEHEESAEAAQDPEETIVVQDDEMECEPVQPESSFGSNESVIITRQETAIDSELSVVDATQDEEMPMTTPKPETLVWENIQQDVAIPFNFDAESSISRSVSHLEDEEQMSLPVQAQTEPDTVAGAPREDESEPVVDNAQTPARLVSDRELIRESIGLGRPSLDATLNLSEFIDVRSLSESRRQSRMPDQEAEANVEEADSTSPNRTPVPGKDIAEIDFAIDDSVDEAQSRAEETPSGDHTPATPARDVTELDIALEDLQQPPETNTPRYALPTIASRRKSLPAIPYPHTPFGDNVRPKTSDGATMPRTPSQIMGTWQATTPIRSRPSTAHGMASVTKPNASGKTPRAKTPMAKTPGTSVPQAWKSATKVATPSARTPISRTLFASTPGTSVPQTIVQPAKERFPGLPSRDAYQVNALAEAPVAETPAGSATPKERFPGLPSRQTYSELDVTPAAKSPVPAAPASVKRTPKERFPGLPSKRTYEELNGTPEEESPAEDTAPVTPQPAAEERFPGLPSRTTYDEHAKTAMPTTRFRSPAPRSVKRPATAQKQTSLRKTALKAHTPTARTPMKTPLKAPAFTPGQMPMTPHPAAPLNGLVVLVEVYTSDGDCATPAFTALLQRLGAKTTKTFSERLTHVVYKEGSPNTLQRLRIHNKQVGQSGTGKAIHCVNSRWVTDCDAEGKRMDEVDEAYAVEIDDAPRTAKRRRKSMEPMSLTNVRGSVFKDRKSSLGRSSLGRPPMRMDSPADDSMLKVDEADKENSGEDGSPDTPAYLAAPSTLVQQTAPLKRVRKLDFGVKDQAKNRRLTFFNGGS